MLRQIFFIMSLLQLTRMRVWGTVQLLAKWNPGRWGDRLALGGDPAGPVHVKLTDEEALRQIAVLMATAAARRRATATDGKAPVSNGASVRR